MHDDLDRILSDDVEITPSSGFLSAVMEAVEREAKTPEPLKFPWIRALPGFLAAITALAVAIWSGIGSLNDPNVIAAFDQQLLELTALATSAGLDWIVLACAITIVSAMLPLGLMRARPGR